MTVRMTQDAIGSIIQARNFLAVSTKRFPICKRCHHRYCGTVRAMTAWVLRYRFELKLTEVAALEGTTHPTIIRRLRIIQGNDRLKLRAEAELAAFRAMEGGTDAL